MSDLVIQLVVYGDEIDGVMPVSKYYLKPTSALPIRPGCWDQLARASMRISERGYSVPISRFVWIGADYSRGGQSSNGITVHRVVMNVAVFNSFCNPLVQLGFNPPHRAAAKRYGFGEGTCANVLIYGRAG